MFASGLLRGSVALVSGGGSGIGRETARWLASLGAHVAICSRRVDMCRSEAARIRRELAGSAVDCSERTDDGQGRGRYVHPEGATAGNVCAFECNIRDQESVERCVHAVLERYGRIDLLVNNAGGQFPCPAADISRKGWHAVIDTNLTGTFLLSQCVYRLAFARQRSGAIVNVVANMWNGFPIMSHTGAARAGVVNLTKSLAVEWAADGVRVNAVAPGLIQSSGLDTYPEAFQQTVREASRHNYAQRMGTEAEIAAAIVFLLSPASMFTTGETLRVDGAESIYSPLWPPRSHANLSARL